MDHLPPDFKLFCRRRDCPCYQSLDNHITKDGIYTTQQSMTVWFDKCLTAEKESTAFLERVIVRKKPISRILFVLLSMTTTIGAIITA